MQTNYKPAEIEISTIYGLQWGLCITAVIWAFVLFDTLSSAEGVMNSIWIAVLMVITPWLLWMVSVIIRSILMRKKKRTWSQKRQLQTMGWSQK